MEWVVEWVVEWVMEWVMVRVRGDKMGYCYGVNLCYNLFMKKEQILHYLTSVKNKYQKEGFLIKALFGSYSRDEEQENSDVDVLVEATPEFASHYGFGAIERIHEIQKEMSKALGVQVDLADSTGMGRTAKKFIIDRAIYV